MELDFRFRFPKSRFRSVSTFVQLGGKQSPITMQSFSSSVVVRYAAAIVSVAIAFFVRLFCDQWLKDRSALDFFLAATAFSAWVGGAGPSVLSILLSTLVGLWFFVPPRKTLLITDFVDLIETASFIFSAVAIAWLSWIMKKRQAELAREIE